MLAEIITDVGAAMLTTQHIKLLQPRSSNKVRLQCFFSCRFDAVSLEVVPLHISCASAHKLCLLVAVPPGVFGRIFTR